MKARGFFLFPMVALLGACASLGGWNSDEMPADVAPTPAAEAPTSAQDYSAGLELHSRGDDAGARRRWMRCVEESPASAPEHLDCLVAIERLAAPPPASN